MKGFIKTWCLCLVLIFSFVRNGNGDCPNIISRSEWGAQKGDKVDYIIFPVRDVIIHHTVGQRCFTVQSCKKYLRNIQRYHIYTTKFDDIGYNFVIGNDGNVYEGVGWHRLGAHTFGHNRDSIGIAFTGNYEDVKPSKKQLQTLKELLACGILIGELEPNYRLLGARQFRDTVSPGDKLFNEISTWHHFVEKP